MLDTTKEIYCHSHTNFKQLAKNSLKPFQRFDFKYVLWDSQLQLYVLINETKNWNPDLLSLFTHFKKQGQKNLKRMEKERGNNINETEKNNKTKSNKSKRKKSSRPRLCIQLCKVLFPDAYFPTEVIL